MRQSNLNLGVEVAAPKLERSAWDAPVRVTKTKGDSPRRIVIRVTALRVRLLDEDNLCEKFHIDSLRYAGIISGDEAHKVKIEARQEKVESAKDEKTVIEIFATEDMLGIPKKLNMPKLKL